MNDETLNPPYGEVVKRLRALEDWRVEMVVAAARDSERRVHLDSRFDNLEKRIEEINGTLKWVNRLIIAAIITGIMAFILRGGLTTTAEAAGRLVWG